MDFDRFTAVLLVLRDDAPDLAPEDAAALQDAHMAHLAELHDQGYLLAAGPLEDDTFRGLSILSVGADEAVRLSERDPAVVAGRFRAIAIPWMVPAGAVSFSHTIFPRSMRELE